MVGQDISIKLLGEEVSIKEFEDLEPIDPQLVKEILGEEKVNETNIVPDEQKISILPDIKIDTEAYVKESGSDNVPIQNLADSCIDYSFAEGEVLLRSYGGTDNYFYVVGLTRFFAEKANLKYNSKYGECFNLKYGNKNIVSNISADSKEDIYYIDKGELVKIGFREMIDRYDIVYTDVMNQVYLFCIEKNVGYCHTEYLYTAVDDELTNIISEKTYLNIITESSFNSGETKKYPSEIFSKKDYENISLELPLGNLTDVFDISHGSDEGTILAFYNGGYSDDNRWINLYKKGFSKPKKLFENLTIYYVENWYRSGDNLNFHLKSQVKHVITIDGISLDADNLEDENLYISININNI